jgi:hypothetical protein
MAAKPRIGIDTRSTPSREETTVEDYRRRPPMEGFSRPGSLGGEAWNDEDSVEGHAGRLQATDDDDTEGHAGRLQATDDDDTEGHAGRLQATDDDDTEGHAGRLA